jgi:hypothetical protein
MFQKMLPTLYDDMEQKEMPMTPYVYSLHDSPERGIKDFMESPRYSSGYTSLFNCFSFITEAHVYKSFQARVEHTLGFLETLTTYAAKNNSKLLQVRKEADISCQKEEIFALNWQLDSSQFEPLSFRGYERETRVSDVTGLKMKFYDKSQPYTKKINHYNHYLPLVSVTKPKFYLISQAYTEVIQRLEWNNVIIDKIAQDTIINVSSYTIDRYKTVSAPYEAHYLHYEIKVTKNESSKKFFKGDYLVSTDQKNVRYLIETMEPQSVDGFFAWNFFDGILQQKEWFSDYAFEPKAKKLLAENEDLTARFKEMKKSDSTFAADNFAQLYFIYKNSPFYEKTVNEYPIYRVE